MGCRFAVSSRLRPAARLRLPAAWLLVLVSALPAAGQARATGTVRDTEGRPIKGATVRAINHDAAPPEFTATTDDRGRWAMIGLRSGTWMFIADAPGFNPVQAEAELRVAGSPPLTFTLARRPGPPPDALSRDIQQLVAAANALRDDGRLDEAIAAYLDIRAKNPKLASVNLVLADLYRRKAAQESDVAARRALLERAIQTYGELLKRNATHERAAAALEATRAEVAALE
jgi:tetratricopeptide (TPR) repeat protein